MFHGLSGSAAGGCCRVACGWGPPGICHAVRRRLAEPSRGCSRGNGAVRPAELRAHPDQDRGGRESLSFRRTRCVGWLAVGSGSFPDLVVSLGFRSLGSRRATRSRVSQPTLRPTLRTSRAHASARQARETGMLIGQSVICPTSAATYYTPWMPRQGEHFRSGEAAGALPLRDRFGSKYAEFHRDPGAHALLAGESVIGRSGALWNE